ncbi:MAG: type IV pili methyl-accepting chemotaxis transducer N-terminal domain-containing protein [Cellvibrionaceae bacterium]
MKWIKTYTTEFLLFTKLLLPSLLLMGITSVEASSGIQSMGEAVNIAGRQRMLSQRIAQSYFLVALRPQSKRGQVQLDRAVSEFERNLKNLRDYKPAESLKRDLKTVESLWIPYKTLATASVSKANAQVLFTQSNTLLKSAHAYVGSLEQISGTKKAEVINISGRQRMLSQRIAKNFLASHWGLEGDNSTAMLYEDIAEYENVLSYLSELEINTPEIQTQLNKVNGQFKYASKGFDGAMSLSGQRLIHVVTGTTDSMLRGMNIVTGQYAQLLKD